MTSRLKTAAVLSVLVMASACSHGGSDAAGSGSGGKGKRGGGGGVGGKLEYPVDVAKLEARKMQYSVEAPGSIEAFQQVQITARVAGAVDKVTFAEGQAVKAGDTLASIESERYAIAVAQAQSALARANATEKSAELALNRRLDAQKQSPGVVAGEEVEEKQTAVDQAKADVDSAQQALRVAQLNLRDSAVRAPIAGIVQTRTVQQGEYLVAGAVLATILQRDPMLLRFQVNEEDAPRLKEGMAAQLTLNESTRTFTAKITLVAGAADPTTRLVPITAQVDATDHQYWLRPGAFCEVSVPVGDARDGIVVPSLAVAPTEKGNVVYTVDDKNIAHQKLVETGMHTSDGNIEITRGVAAGDLLVVRGIEALTEGAPVKISSTMTLEQASAPPPDAGVAPSKPVSQ
jgi:membrane fusion protein, multidrug efflux system